MQVILAETNGNSKHKVAIGAFVMPNKPIDANAPLTSFAVPLERLEAVSGVRYAFLHDFVIILMRSVRMCVHVR